MQPEDEEAPHVRDSFALDYNPDYDKEQSTLLVGGDSLTQTEGLTSKALAGLSQSSVSRSRSKKKKKKNSLLKKNSILHSDKVSLHS